VTKFNTVAVLSRRESLMALGSGWLLAVGLPRSQIVRIGFWFTQTLVIVHAPLLHQILDRLELIILIHILGLDLFTVHDRFRRVFM
jgi:hypothetical protein